MGIFDGKNVLITGGTGSFGKSFSKHLLKNTNLNKLAVFSRDELKQHQMEQEIQDERLRFFIGDVREVERLRRAFYKVDIVIHASALKQVPRLEYNPFEAVKTNILGTQNVIEAAIDENVSQVLLISTDKAVEPINLYGSTKLCAEKLTINGNFYSRNGTKLSCVRYGNVIGSRGSIVEALLEKKKNNSNTVKITDERMTRFWITLPQSFQLVTFALEKMRGGEIFIPKIPSMKLVDLFEAIIPEAQKEVIGIRPGEKLHESLLTDQEARHALDLGKYFCILPEYKEFVNVEEKFKIFFTEGKKLPEDFRYASDSNTDWLTKKDLQEFIYQ